MIRDIELEALRNDGLTLAQVAWNLQLTRWMNAAAISLFIYDAFLILADEVRLLWPKRWSVIKAFYFLNRALCASFAMIASQQFINMNTVSDEYCVFYLLGIGVASSFAFAMCNWIFLARTRALVRIEQPYLDVALVIYFAITCAITGVLTAITSYQIHKSIFFSPTLRTCAAATHPKTMGTIWICPMIFETTIFVLAAFKIHQNTKSRNGHIASHLFSVLFRDGVCYYVSICIFRIWNLVLWNMRPVSPVFTGFFMLWSIMSIASSRLHLNLLAAASPLEDTGVSTDIPMNNEVTMFGHRGDGNRWARRNRWTVNSGVTSRGRYDICLHAILSTFIPTFSTVSNFTVKVRHSQALGAQTEMRTSIEPRRNIEIAPDPTSSSASTG